MVINEDGEHVNNDLFDHQKENSLFLFRPRFLCGKASGRKRAINGDILHPTLSAQIPTQSQIIPMIAVRPFVCFAVLATFALAIPSQQQKPLLSAQLSEAYQVDPEIHAAVAAYPDPVDALIALRPELATQLSERRLIKVFGEDVMEMTEGDKLRLRRAGKKFIDLTQSQGVVEPFMAGHARESY